MEVIAGWTHRAFVVSDLSCVGEARRYASRLVEDRGWSDIDVERAAIVVTELATNLAKHARGGELLIAARDALQDLEVIAVDRGPGIAEVERAMRDGFSTSATPGAGLGAITRQSESFEIHSSEATGTVSVARLRRRKAPAGTNAAVREAPRRRFHFGAVCVPIQGESVCGDGWAVAFDGPRAATLLADGLGHGPDAALASAVATRHFCAQPFEPPQRLLSQTHEALRATRGAAVFGLWLDHTQLSYAGAGNVMGRLISGTSDKSLVTPHGTMGLQARRLEPAAAELPPHGTVLIHSDGVQSRWSSDALGALLQKDPVLLAARVYADHARGRDDVCILALRPEDAA